MIPTEEEKQKIQEAQLANPDVPLGSAEQFLLTLSSISELSARLQLWAFKMDYEATEKVCINMSFIKVTKPNELHTIMVWVNVHSMCACVCVLCPCQYQHPF